MKFQHMGPEVLIFILAGQGLFLSFFLSLILSSVVMQLATL